MSALAALRPDRSLAGWLRGIALHDELTGRTWGNGELVRGMTPALMLAVCGRTVAFDQLTGPGLALLQSRIT